MADQALRVAGRDGTGKATDAVVQSDRKKPVRKVYSHVMTDADKFALRTVQRAADACRQLSEAIKNGKPVKAEAVNSCSQLVQHASDMIFSC